MMAPVPYDGDALCDQRVAPVRRALDLRYAALGTSWGFAVWFFWLVVVVVGGWWFFGRRRAPRPPASRVTATTAPTLEHGPLLALSEPGNTEGATEISLDGGSPDKGPPIPRRPVHAVRIPDGTELKLEVSYAFQGPGGGFLKDARRYAGRTQSEVPHVPFKHYWSTYSDMDDGQKRWYFYWRTQLRAGKMLPTDLSYLFVHIYECLHAVGFDDAGQAFRHLLELWKHYREQHPNIDHYLGHWTLDFNAYYGLGMEPLGLVRELAGEGVRFPDRDLAVASWVETRDYDRLAPELLASIAGFDPRSGKFYREFPDTSLINRTLTLALEAVDAYYTATTGQSPFETYAPARERDIKRFAFSGAVFELPRKEVSIATVPAYSESDNLATLLESVLKFTENTLRKQVGFKGQRRGIELPQSLETYLRHVLGGSKSQPVAKLVERRTIEIDLEKLGQLERDSDDIRERLQVGEGEEIGMSGSLGTQGPVPETEVVRPVIGATERHDHDLRPGDQGDDSEYEDLALPVPACSTRFKIPPDTPAGQLTDVDVVARVLDGLSRSALALLHGFRTSAWELVQQAASSFGEVNAASMAILGEELITLEQGVAVVVDDYRDELEFLLVLDAYAARPLGDGSPSGMEDQVETIPSAWLEFRSGITPLQMQALTQLINGCSQAQVDAFAREHSTLPALLLDEINERALDTIGDNLIDTYAEPVIIFEEHRNAVRSMILA